MEKIKLLIDLYKEDVKATLKLLLPIIIMIYLVKELPILTRSLSINRLDSEIMGVIDEVNKVKGIQESEQGGRVKIKSFEIDYHYYVETKKIIQKENLSGRSLNVKQRAFINRLHQGDSIQVKYDSGNPEKSRLKIK